MFNIAKNQNYDGYQKGLAATIYNFFDKKFSGDAITRTDRSPIKSKIMSSQSRYALFARKTRCANYYKIWKRKRKKHSSFTDNIWGAHCADIQLISKYNNEFWFTIDIFCKYA